MRILIACESSGIVREECRRLGHDAVSCDLLPSEIPGPHIQGDVRPLLREYWDLVIAHPPCTRLCNSGVRWLEERNLWEEMRDAAAFFRLFLELDHIQRVAIENPIMHAYAKYEIGRCLRAVQPTQIIQPWQYGHGVTNATCLWLKGLPDLMPTDVVDGRVAECHHASPGPDRWKDRSRTYQGIARAMAEQWTAGANL